MCSETNPETPALVVSYFIEVKHTHFQLDCKLFDGRNLILFFYCSSNI